MTSISKVRQAAYGSGVHSQFMIKKGYFQLVVKILNARK
jgi:hypothetical protein